MKRIILPALFLLFLSLIDLHAQWAKTYGERREDRLVSIQKCHNGGYIAAGLTRSFTGANSDIWLVRLAYDGEFMWQKCYGGIKDDMANCVRETRDKGYIIAGKTSSLSSGGSDLCLLKLDSSGEMEWQKTYGGSRDEEAYSLQETSDGGYIVAGVTNSYGIGLENFWILKLTNNGETEWQKIYGGKQKDVALCVQQTQGDGYIIAGYTHSFGEGGVDFWILKLKPNGEIDWQYTYGNISDDFAYCIRETVDQGLIVVGSTYVPDKLDHDIWIIKLGIRGNIEWQKSYGGEENDIAYSVQQTFDGGYIVAGITESFGQNYHDAPKEDIFLMKLTFGGDIEWQYRYGADYSYEIARSVEQLPDGGYVLAGSTQSWGEGDVDGWILKLRPTGKLTLLSTFLYPTDMNGIETHIKRKTHDVLNIEKNFLPDESSMTQRKSKAKIYHLGENLVHTLRLEHGGHGDTEPSKGKHTYENGEQVTIQAHEYTDCRWEGWRGNIQGGPNPVTIVLDGDKTIETTFSYQSPSEPYGPVDWGGGGGGGWGGGCFIATAAYNSPHHPHVQCLREFRDKFLLNNKLGRMFITVYYKLSPQVARFLSRNKASRFMVRILLFPIVAWSYVMVNTGYEFKILLLLAILFVPVYQVLRKERYPIE
jgi:hypothetical protein